MSKHVIRHIVNVVRIMGNFTIHHQLNTQCSICNHSNQCVKLGMTTEFLRLLYCIAFCVWVFTTRKLETEETTNIKCNT